MGGCLKVGPGENWVVNRKLAWFGFKKRLDQHAGPAKGNVKGFNGGFNGDASLPGAIPHA